MRRNIDAIFLGQAQPLHRLSLVRAWCFMLGVASIQACGCSWQQAATTVAGAPITLHVASDGELLAFDPTELSCPTGARVRVVFHHTGWSLDGRVSSKTGSP